MADHSQHRLLLHDLYAWFLGLVKQGYILLTKK